MDIKPHPLLTKYQWKKRLLLLFAPSEETEAYKLQLQELLEQEKGLDERDLIILYIFANRVELPGGKSLDRSEAAGLRQHYIIPDKETVLLLIGKDGSEKLRSRDLITTDRLFLTIDAMPMRQQEMKGY